MTARLVELSRASLRRPVIRLALLALSLAPGAAAQEKESTRPAPIVRIGLELVQVDAVVTDSDGRHVTDLEASDFEIHEDGREQVITNCVYVSLETPTGEPVAGAAGPAGPALPRFESIRRAIAVVVDDLGLSLESVFPVQSALREFVDQQMLPGDLVAIVRTSTGMGALQQFTSDRRLLHAAIDRIRFNLAGRGSVAAFSLPGPHGSGGMAGFEAEMKRQRQVDLTIGTLGAIHFVLRGLQQMPGRKSVLVVSDGFPVYDYDGSPARVLDAIRGLTDLANRASTVIYSFDPRGLMTLGVTAAAAASLDSPTAAFRNSRRTLEEMRWGLSNLADDTGGLLIADTNDLVGGVARILDDQRGYYLIGYSPDEASFRPDEAGPAYHKIELKTKRRGLRVRSRRGYYGVADSEATPTPRDPAQRLVAAAQSPFVAPDIGVRLTALFGHEPQRGSIVRSLLHLDAEGLTFSERPDGSRATELQLVTLVFGSDGRAVESLERDFRLSVPDSAFGATLRRGLVYSFETPIPRPGGYQVRVAVLDAASGRVGSASQFVEVPRVRKGRLVLSGIAMSGVGLGAGPDPQTTPSVRRFPQGASIMYAFFAYNARSAKSGWPRLEVRLTVYRESTPVHETGPMPFDAAGQPDPARLAVIGRLNPGPGLEPGAYTLEVAVTDLDARGEHAVARQWADFEIVEHLSGCR